MEKRTNLKGQKQKDQYQGLSMSGLTIRHLLNKKHQEELMFKRSTLKLTGLKLSGLC